MLSLGSWGLGPTAISFIRQGGPRDGEQEHLLSADRHQDAGVSAARILITVTCPPDDDARMCPVSSESEELAEKNPLGT
jgi:hypothetical protein